MSKRMSKQRVIDALEMGIKRRKPSKVIPFRTWQPGTTRSRIIHCRNTTLSIRGNPIMTSTDGNVGVRNYVLCGTW